MLDEIDHILLLLSCNGVIDITRSELAVASLKICATINARGVLARLPVDKLDILYQSDSVALTIEIMG